MIPVEPTFLERYLRATGWRFRSAFNGKREWEWQCWTAWVPEDGQIPADTMSHIGAASKRRGYEVVVSIGLCISAEALLREASLFSTPARESDALRRAAASMLRMAGVDPKRWEDSRED